MAIAKCTEGDKNQPNFDISIGTSSEASTPEICLIIPDECYPDEEYDEHGFPNNKYEGEGCFKIDLKDVLEEYILDNLDESESTQAHAVSSILREYADKIDNAVKADKDS